MFKGLCKSNFCPFKKKEKAAPSSSTYTGYWKSIIPDSVCDNKADNLDKLTRILKHCKRTTAHHRENLDNGAIFSNTRYLPYPLSMSILLELNEGNQDIW